MILFSSEIYTQFILHTVILVVSHTFHFNLVGKRLDAEFYKCTYCCCSFLKSKRICIALIRFSFSFVLHSIIRADIVCSLLYQRTTKCVVDNASQKFTLKLSFHRKPHVNPITSWGIAQQPFVWCESNGHNSSFAVIFIAHYRQFMTLFDRRHKMHIYFLLFQSREACCRMQRPREANRLFIP